MTTLFLLLNTIIYFLETVKTYELNRTKDKGHDAQTSQPLDTPPTNHSLLGAKQPPRGRLFICLIIPHLRELIHMAKLPPLPINSVQYGLIKRFKALPDAENYYRQHLSKLSQPNAAGWANALCPIHGDRNNSLMVNLRIGCFKCMACGASGSNIAAFHAALTNTDYRTAFNALVSK